MKQVTRVTSSKSESQPGHPKTVHKKSQKRNNYIRIEEWISDVASNSNVHAMTDSANELVNDPNKLSLTDDLPFDVNDFNSIAMTDTTAFDIVNDFNPIPLTDSNFHIVNDSSKNATTDSTSFDIVNESNKNATTDSTSFETVNDFNKNAITDSTSFDIVNDSNKNATSESTTLNAPVMTDTGGSTTTERTGPTPNGTSEMNVKEEENSLGDSGVSSPSDTKRFVGERSVGESGSGKVEDGGKSPGGSSDLSDAETVANSQSDQVGQQQQQGRAGSATRPSSSGADEEEEEDEGEESEGSEATLGAISVRRPEDLMRQGAAMAAAQATINGPTEECPICLERFPSGPAFENHRVTAGHFSCPIGGSGCGGAFKTAADLNAHQTNVHQSGPPPVQQLAQQVQRIPASFQQSSYRQPPPSNRNVYMPMGGAGQQQQQLGSGVTMTPAAPQPPPPQPQNSIPSLPPGIQLSKRAAPPSVTLLESPHKQPRREDGNSGSSPSLRLPESITLVSRTPAPPPPPRRDTVADILANRGITVVPSGRPQSSPSSLPQSVRNLNSAISITPSSGGSPSSQRSGFAVPSSKPATTMVPTVDLTKEVDPPRRTISRPIMRGRGPAPPSRVVCQICDKAFPTQEALSQHMLCHRGGGPSAKPQTYECRECTAQYPSQARLDAHRQKYHGAGGPAPDMAIPVVDLRQAGVMSKLAALGVRSVIPLAQLHNGAGGGMFGLPVVAVDAASNPAFCNIGGIGASNLLPLGPLKNLSFNNMNTNMR